MTEWREVCLGDYAKVLGGYAFKSTDFLPYGDYPVIKIKNIAKGYLDMSECQYISSSIAAQASRFKAEYGDILIAMTGSHITQPSSMVGRVAKYNIHVESYINQRVGKVISIDKSLLDTNFLYYFMTCEDTTYSLANIASGSANQANISSEQIESLELLLPDIDEQKAIAEVLSSLDDKIDLLTRQNKTLEDLAQAYFRKWFIENASAEWEVGKLGDEFNITMGQSPKGETYNDLKIGLPFFQGKAEFGFRFPLEKHYCSEPIKIADKFDTLLSVRAPVGALNMAMYKCCIGRGLAVPIHKKGYKHYTFYKMKSLQEVFDTFDDDGTVFGSISREKFLSIENVIPPEKLVCSFDNFARHFDLKIYENTVQIWTLTKLRDTLLPKLISGEIRVKM